jgi:hypothetical protein
MTRKTTYLILLTLCLNVYAKAITTNIQFVNNSGDAALNTIDIYVNNLLFVNDLSFREATAMLTITANTSINIGVAPGSSLTITDTFKNFNVSLSNLNDHVAVLNGIKSASGYTPATPVSLDMYAGYRTLALNPFNVDVIFANGVTDGQAMDLRTGIQTVSNDVTYKTFSASYTSLTSADIKMRLTNTIGSSIIGTYNANFMSNAFTGKGVLIVASGFVNTTANSNGPAMGLWACTASGGPLVPFSSTTGEAVARCQIIHNCADTTADTVDIYVNGVNQFDNMRFRNATAFFDVLAKVNTQIDVAHHTSTSAATAFYTYNVTFDSAGKHILVADGIQSAAGYNPKPPYIMHKYNGAEEAAANLSNTDVLFINGSTDAGAITVTEGANTWYTSIAYGSFNGSYYTAGGNSTRWLHSSLQPVNQAYILDVPGKNLQGTAITLLASGFKDSTVNSKGPSLGFWYATASGGPLTMLVTANVGIAPVNTLANNLIAYPIPAHNTLYINNSTAVNGVILDMQGKVVKPMSNVTNMVDISDIATGTYMLQLNNATTTQTIRFIKQ